MDILSTRFCAMIISASLFLTNFSSALAEEQSISNRMMHYRAVDSVVWAMPMLNFKQFRDGHRASGVKQT